MSGRRPSRGTGHRGLALFLAVPLLILTAVSIGTAVFSERLARSNALAAAEASAVRLTRYLVAPVLTEAMAGIPGRWEDLDLRIQNRLADRSITTVFVWAPPGDVLYTSDGVELGPRLAATQGLRTAAAGRIVSWVDDTPPHGVVGGVLRPRLEVYVPLHVGALSLAVVTFFSYEGIAHETDLLRGQIIPLAIGALVVLQLVQVPIGISLFRRVRRQDAGRSALLARGLTASERERRSIAADVHDGPVQDLTGVAYALAALRPSVPAGQRSALDGIGAAVRDTVAWLRRLMEDLYPRELAPPDLGAALEDLAAELRSADLEVSVQLEPVPDVGPDRTAVLYRTAKLALAEAAAAPGRHRAWLRYGPDGNESTVRLQVGHRRSDDGGQAAGGRVPTPRVSPAMSLLRTEVAALDGTLEVGRLPTQDSVVTVVMPAAP